MDGGEVLLPPQKLLVGRAQGRQAVVGVHDDVDDTVEHGVKRALTT